MIAKDIKNGTVVNYNDAPCIIETINVQSPSARGAATIYKYRARNLVTKQKIDIVLRGGESLDEADFERRPVKFMYADATHMHFLDQEDYNQYALPRGRPRRRGQVPHRSSGRRAGPDLQRRVRRHAIADRRGAEGHAVRPGRQGQLGHQPHQAGHARNRPDRASARVPGAGRDGQGRHAHRRVSCRGCRLSRCSDLLLPAGVAGVAPGDQSPRLAAPPDHTRPARLSSVASSTTASAISSSDVNTVGHALARRARRA